MGRELEVRQFVCQAELIFLSRSLEHRRSSRSSIGSARTLSSHGGESSYYITGLAATGSPEVERATPQPKPDTDLFDVAAMLALRSTAQGNRKPDAAASRVNTAPGLCPTFGGHDS